MFVVPHETIFYPRDLIVTHVISTVGVMLPTVLFMLPTVPLFMLPTVLDTCGVNTYTSSTVGNILGTVGDNQKYRGEHVISTVGAMLPTVLFILPTVLSFMLPTVLDTCGVNTYTYQITHGTCLLTPAGPYYSHGT